MLKSIKIIIFSGLIAFSAATLFGQTTAQKFMTRYELVYPEKDTLLVSRLIEKSTALVAEAERFFGVRSNTLISIYLTPSQVEFDSYAQLGVPEWAQAVAIPSKNLIVIKYDSPEALQRLPQLLLHELTHVYLARSGMAERMPVWLHEGLAQWVSREELSVDERILISAALNGNRVISLADMETVLQEGSQKARLVYALARSSVDYMDAAYGREKIRLVLQGLQQNKTLQEAFVQATGEDLVDFEFGWYNWLEKKYRWMFLLSFDNLLWAGLVFLFIIAVITIRLRNRRTERKWREEDEGYI